MIISFILKNIRSIIDALIIAAIIVIFVIFDPFKWFNTGINIRNTPVSVQNIRQIGQLITAEYYGESIASLHESYMESVDANRINEEGQDLFLNLMMALDSLKKTDHSGWFTFDAIHKWNIEKKLGDYFPWIANSKLFPLVTDYLCDSINSALNKKAYNRKDFLFELYKNRKIVFRGNVLEGNSYLNNFYKYVANRKEIEFKELKKDIVYIGRGWVKAGIDFGKLKPNDIFYNSSNKTLYIKNCEPEILDCDINPWFIPNKVKGFELIKQKGSFDNPFAEAVRVKKACIENLRIQAYNSGIIKQAKENARLSLMNLFSLLMDSEVSQVTFTKNKFDQILHELKKDTLISNQEAIFINALTQKSLTELDTTYYNDYRMQLSDLIDFCNRIRAYQYAASPVNGIALDMAPFFQNEQVDTIELKIAINKLCSLSDIDSTSNRSKIFRLMANYRLPENEFIDSCIALNLKLGQDTTKFQHTLSSMASIYRDKLYNQAMRICTETVTKPRNHYSIWFSSNKDFDTALLKTAQYLQSKCDNNKLRLSKSALNKLSKDTIQTNTILKVFEKNIILNK